MLKGLPVQPVSAVSQRATEISSIVEDLSDSYRWLFFAAYDRTVRGEAKTRSSSRPDPVGELIVDGLNEDDNRLGGKNLMRKNLAIAAKLTEEALAKLQKAHRLVAGDPRVVNHPSWKRVAGSLDSLDPRSIDMRSTGRLGPGDYIASVAALARREERGDGFGES